MDAFSFVSCKCDAYLPCNWPFCLCHSSALPSPRPPSPAGLCESDFRPQPSCSKGNSCGTSHHFVGVPACFVAEIMAPKAQVAAGRSQTRHCSCPLGMFQHGHSPSAVARCRGCVSPLSFAGSLGVIHELLPRLHWSLHDVEAGCFVAPQRARHICPHGLDNSCFLPWLLPVECARLRDAGQLARIGCIHEVLCNLSLCSLPCPCNPSCQGHRWRVIVGDTCNRKLCVFVRTGSTSIPNNNPWNLTNPGDKQVGAARYTEAVNPFETTSAAAPRMHRERAPRLDEEVVLAGSLWAFRPRWLDSCRCHLPGPRLVGFRPTAAMPAVFSGGSEFATTATPNHQTGDECIQHCRALCGRRHTTKTHAKKVWYNASALVTDIAPTAVLSCTKQNTMLTINSVPSSHTLTNLGPAAFGAGGADHACVLRIGGGGQSKNGVNRKFCRIGLPVPVLPVRVLPVPVLPVQVAKQSRHPLMPVPVLPVRVATRRHP